MYKNPKSFIKVAMEPSENQSTGCSETAAWEEEHGEPPSFDFSKTFSESSPRGTPLLMMWELGEMLSLQGPYSRKGRYLLAAPITFMLGLEQRFVLFCFVLTCDMEKILGMSKPDVITPELLLISEL